MKTYEQHAKDIEILRTNDGYMVLDTQTDEYLHDSNGDNCFNFYEQAKTLAHDLIKTRLEHQED